MENKSFEEYVSGLTLQRQKMLNQKLASFLKKLNQKLAYQELTCQELAQQELASIKKMLKQIKKGRASIKELGQNEYEFVSEVENEDGQKKYRNNTKQKQAMKNKKIAARRKKNKIKH